MSGLDYDSDNDPLAYMTSDYRSQYLVESRIDMERRFFLRGKRAPKVWQRVTVRLMLYVPLALLGLIAVVAATKAVTHLLGK